MAVIEGGVLTGRAQEWNICRAELDALTSAGCLSRSDAAASIAAEFNPVRASFVGSPPTSRGTCSTWASAPPS